MFYNIDTWLVNKLFYEHAVVAEAGRALLATKPVQNKIGVITKYCKTLLP
jgi:hypothetical protein